MVSSDACTETFVQATVEVLRDLYDEEYAPTPIVNVPSPVSILDVAVIVGLTGDWQGRVLFEFSMPTALGVVSVMNFGEVFEDLDSMARATLSELGNLVAGRAVTLVNDRGGMVHISPPILMAGLGMRSSDESPVQRFTVPTSSGEVGVNIAVKMSNKENSHSARRAGHHLNGVAG